MTASRSFEVHPGLDGPVADALECEGERALHELLLALLELRRRLALELERDGAVGLHACALRHGVELAATEAQLPYEVVRADAVPVVKARRRARSTSPLLPTQDTVPAGVCVIDAEAIELQLFT